MDDELFLLRGTELWKSDGTVDGTQRVTTAASPWVYTRLENLRGPRMASASGDVFVIAPKRPYRPARLWATNGTGDGWTDLGVQDVIAMTEMNGEMFFLRYDWNSFGLWKSDGTIQGTQLVSQVGELGWTKRTLSNLTAVGDDLYFAEEGRLWKYDGSSNEVNLVKAFPRDSNPSELTAADGRLFFSTSDDLYGNELWVSDGTAAGTVLAADIRPGPLGSHPSEFTVWNNRLFFAANDGSHGEEL